MYTDLKGKTAVITGASSGLGKDIAIRLALEKVNVVINYFKDKQEATLLVDQIHKAGGKAIAIEGDVGNEKDVLNIVSQTIQTFGGFDIWINNAGRQKETPSHELSLEEWNGIINTNLTGTFLGSRESIKHYIATGKKGVIINMSSVHEKIPRPHYVHYSASKGGVKMLTETLALEYAKHGIRINAIAPGAIYTPINADFKDPEILHDIEAKIPVGYVGKPEYIANVTAWLCSTQSEYVTGTTIFADGGLELYPSFRAKE